MDHQPDARGQNALVRALSELGLKILMSNKVHSRWEAAANCRLALLSVTVIWFCAAYSHAQAPFGSSPIHRLPPIETGNVLDGELRGDPPEARIGSRLGNDPLPPTGSDMDIFRAEPLYDNRTIPPFEPGLANRLGGKADIVILPKLSKHKQGFFQKFDLMSTYIDGGRVGDMGITELETYLTVALPFPTTKQPLLITPGFETRFFEGPLAPDVPSRVYSSYVQFMWLPKIGKRWMGIFGIEPGWYGDYQTSHADYLRILGRALVRYEFIVDRLQLVAGFLYLDRDDIKVLPAGGVIWMPNDDWEFEFLYPKPKIAYRLRPAMSGGRAIEWWVYTGAEFGGDTWTIQRLSGATDKLTLFDIRTYLGIERRLDGGSSLRLEAGLVFARYLKYLSTPGQVNFPATIMLRGGLTY